MNTDGEFELTVDGTLWRLVDDLESANSEDAVYSIVEHNDDSITVSFGDGVHGKRPGGGAKLVLKYRFGGGSKGNIA